MEETVTLENKSNQTLFGILHVPDNGGKSGRRVGINILNPGLKNRVAPNRLNVKIARLLCKRGFYVFRLDPFGIGDSEGELSAKNEDVMDLWGMIQRGTFVDDTILSNSFFIEKVNLDKLILIGQCGAGVTALICGERDKRIKELVLIDTPFRVVSSEVNMKEIAAEYCEPNKLIKEGFSDILNPKKMKKLLTLNINWGLYLNAFRTSISTFFRDKKINGSKNVNNRFNWQMLNAFESFMKRKGKAYFIYAENDFSLKEFTQDFKLNFFDGNKVYNNQCKIDVIKDANHIYTEMVWQDELINNIIGWLSGSHQN